MLDLEYSIMLYISKISNITTAKVYVEMVDIFVPK